MGMIIVKGYRAFDDVYERESSALEVLRGWEHKERMDEVYCLMDPSAQDHWLRYRWVTGTDITMMDKDRKVVQQELDDYRGLGFDE